MPQIIKPRTLGLLHKVERRRNGARFVVCAIAAFDLADSSKLDGEQSLWLMAAEALPPATPLDMCMPKPRAEMLIAGKINAPDATGLMLEAQFAGLSKRIAVFGDRWWSVESERYVATEPRPIGELLLSPASAFGGPGHPTNAAGVGFGATDLIGKGEAVRLPNIEDPAALIHAIGDQPPTATFGPLDLMDPGRQRLAGTYDAAWARDVAPALADDVHPDFFMTAPEGQRLKTYLVGDETYWLRNFSSSAHIIEGRLPGVRPRAFLGQKNGNWSEVSLALDTVWFVAGARRGILLWHGVAPVEDIEGKDVSDLMLAYERLGEMPRSVEHYAEVRRLRRDPATAMRYVFSEWQLTPPRDPAEDARRKAARMARGQEQAAKRAEGIAYLSNKWLDDAGVPEALRPPPPGSDLPPLILPLPTPEEIESGDFDLGDVLDLVEEKKAESHEALRALAEKGMPVIEAMKAINAPGAGEKEVDALLAAVTAVAEVDIAGELDKAFSQMEAPASDDGGSPSAAFQGMVGEAERVRDWRALLLEQVKGRDDDFLVKEALGRFLKLPEASPLAEARAAVKELGNRPAPDLSELPGPSAGAPEQLPPPNALSSLLDELAGNPDISPAALAETRQEIAAAGAELSKKLPGIAAAGDGNVLDTLLSELQKMSPADAPQEPGGTDAALDANVDDLLRRLDDAERQLDDGMATARLMCPKASHPTVPMTPRISRRFGDGVLDHIKAGISLAGRDLAGVDLAGADLSGLDFSGAFLERANLANARLRGANLSKATLAEARLEYADLTDADLTDANLSGVNGRGMCLDGTALSSTLILQANFAGAKARGTTFSGTRFIEVDFSGADLSGARLERVTLMRITAAGARFDKATFRRCQVVDADLTEASINGAFLDRSAFIKLTAPRLSAIGADVRSSSFLGGAKLSDANFSDGFTVDAGFLGADLTGAKFRRAICDRSLFGDAQLENADFHLASLRRAILDGAKLANADFIGAQLMEAQIHRVDLSWARFQGANLYGADLTDSNLMAADFTGAHLVKSPLDLETVHA